MSLEKALEGLTAAIEGQNKLLAQFVAGQAAPSEEKPAAKEKPAPKEEKKKAKAAPKKSKAKKEEPEDDGEDESIYEKDYYKNTVQPTTKKAAKALGRDAVMGILDEFGTGLETARDLEEDQWEDYVQRLEDEMEAKTDDEDEEDDLS